MRENSPKMSEGYEVCPNFPTEPLRIDIYQGDVLIGSVPDEGLRSRSFIFDIRPGDFRRTTRDGKEILEASRMICPGDFACLEGFRQSPKLPGCYSDTSHAEVFDAMARAMGVKP